MSRLKIERVIREENDYIKCCRWCKFYCTSKYGGGVCINRSTYSVDEDGEYVYEDSGIESPDTYVCSEWK